MIRRWLARALGAEMVYGHLAEASVNAVVREEMARYESR